MTLRGLYALLLTVACLGCGADDDADVQDAPRDVPSEDAREDTARDAPRDMLVDPVADDGETGRDDGVGDTSADTGDLDPVWVEMEGAATIERALQPGNALRVAWGPCRPAPVSGCEELSEDTRYQPPISAADMTTASATRDEELFLGFFLKGGPRILTRAVVTVFDPDTATVRAAWRSTEEDTSVSYMGLGGPYAAYEVAYPGSLSRIYHMPVEALSDDAFPIGELTDVQQPGAAAIVRMLASETTVATLIGSAQKFFVFEDGRRVERGRDREVGVARGAVQALALHGRRLIWAVRDDYLVTAAHLDAPAEMLFDAADSEPIFLIKADGEHIVWTTMFDAERSALWVSPFATSAEEFEARRLRTLVNFADPHLGDGRVAYRARDPGRIYLIDLDTGRQRTFDLPGDLNPGAIARVAGEEVIVMVAPGATADSRLLRLDFSGVPYDDE